MESHVEAFLSRQLTASKTPSLQYTFFSIDRPLYTFRGGLADIASQHSVDDRTTIHFFSITKTITALAVLQLQEAGLLDITKPVKKYLHDFPFGDDIQIKHLLSHSAGIPNPIPLSWLHLEEDDKAFNQKDFFAHVLKNNTKTRSKPNHSFSYSNIGYIILGDVIERVSGQSYKQVIQNSIFNKLKVCSKELSFTIQPTLHAVGYHPRWSFSNLILGVMLDRAKFMSRPIGRWVPFNTFYVNGAAYGGVVGSMNGLMKYGQELLNTDSILLENRWKQELFQENVTFRGKRTGMCLSWFKGSMGGALYYTHAGGGGGYYSEIRLYPTLGRGSIVLLNRTGFADERLLSCIDKHLLHKL